MPKDSKLSITVFKVRVSQIVRARAEDKEIHKT